MEGGTLNAIWAELALNTRPFKKGLSDAQVLTQQFGRKIAGDIRLSFFNSLSPARWATSTMNAIRSSMREIEQTTTKAIAAQIKFGLQDLPLEQVAAFQALVDRLGVSMETLAKLFKDNTAAGAEFRSIVGTVDAPISTDVVHLSRGAGKLRDDTVNEMAKQVSDGSWLRKALIGPDSWQGDKRSLGGRLAGKALEIGPQVADYGKQIVDAEKRILELAKEREEAEAKALEDAKEMERLNAESLKRRIGNLKERSALLSGDVRFADERIARFAGGNVGGGLASIGGFTAGAGLNAATVQSQQLNVLKMMDSKLSTISRVLELQASINELSG